jgi:hypothetical protein
MLTKKNQSKFIFQQIFRSVINKERNISSTRAIKIQAGLTIQIEKHSKIHTKNYTENKNIPSLCISNKRRRNTLIFSYILEHICI